MSGYIKTMKDLEAATYGIRGGAGNAVLKSAGVVGGIHGTGHDLSSAAALAGSVTAATGMAQLYNVVYGKKVWSMINQECNALSMIAKRPYTASGWRVLIKRPEGGGNSTFQTATGGAATGRGEDTVSSYDIGGVAEHARLVTDIPALSPQYTQLKTSPKTIAHLFEFSELALEMAKIDDGVGDLRALIREDMGKHHAEVQNKMLLMPLEDYDQEISNADTVTAGVLKGYTSLMKIVSSSAEMNEMRTSSMVDDSAIGALDEKLVTLFGDASRQVTGSDTPSSTFMDAVVNYGTDYESTRVLTLTVLNDTLRQIRENGGSPKVILTGYDTIQHIGDLLQAQERFMDRKEIIPTHNGIRGVKGSEVGFRVATYFDIPIIPCKDMPKTTKTSSSLDLSDLLILDTDHLWLSVMKPTQYFEDGIDHGNPFGVGVLGNRALFRTIAETGCSFFKGQGKITNCTSA